VLRVLVVLLALGGLLVGVFAAVVALRSEDGSTAAAPPTVLSVLRSPPPPPPPGSVVFARSSRDLAVALAVEPGPPLRLTATILGPAGTGVDGLEVELIAIATGPSHGTSSVARPCGPGCYTTTLRFAAPERFAVNFHGAGRVGSVGFAVPSSWPPPAATAFLRRAANAFKARRTAVFTERLRSSPARGIFTTWKLAAPDRLEYEIQGGAGGIVIGRTRWDRAAPGAAWKRSTTSLLPQPAVPWGSRVANAHVVRETPSRVVLSWMDPGVPSWFTATFDRRTALPIDLRMTAAAHFMRHRYLAFDRQVRIEPP
jgi:hypothetical protein